MEQNEFSYFLKGETKIEHELDSLGIKLIAVDVGKKQNWPALKLPSGAMLLITSDDEGNGPGSIEVAH
jgi:hypothetical protein